MPEEAARKMIASARARGLSEDVLREALAELGRHQDYLVAIVEHVHACAMSVDDLVARRTAEIERALRDEKDLRLHERAQRELLERGRRVMTRFLSVLSHDLRGPIHTALGWTSLLRREHLGRAARDDALARIERATRMQLALLDELLDVSLLVAGRAPIAVKTLDLCSLVGRVVERTSVRATQRGIALAFAAESAACIIFGDERRLEQATTTLIGNALESTPSGGSIGVTVARANGQSVRLEIRDTGRGIAPERLPRVFECSMIDQDGPSGGEGIGLFIARRLVEIHHGTIEAASDGPGQGSTFTIQLPLRELPDMLAIGRQSTPSDPTSILDGVRILVFDEDRDERELMTSLLSTSGAQVVTAADASAALALVETLATDVVIITVEPREGRHDFVRALRRRRPGTPTIVVTATSSEPQDSPRFECDLYLIRPLDPACVVEAVRRAVTALA